MVRFGIVGAGGIANKFARDLLLVDNAKLTAVSARSVAKAEAYKLQYNVEFAFSSYEAMALSDKIDAVYIATPHNFHYEQAILFMRNHKHVLIEKPIAVNLSQYEEMVKVAKDNSVLMMEAMWTRFLPSTRFIKGIIDEGDFGNLVEADIEFGYSLIDNYPEERRLLNPNLAGGSVLDMGVYPLSFFLMINKAEIKEINAKADFPFIAMPSKQVAEYW